MMIHSYLKLGTKFGYENVIKQTSKNNPRPQVEINELLANKNLRPPPIQGKYVLEQILDSKNVKGEEMYLIKWSGYPKNEATWENSKNLENAKKAIEDFKKKQTHKTSMKQKKLKTSSLDEFEVEKILNHVVKGNKTYYLVKWKGYNVSEATLEPEHYLVNAQ
ncbi:hypothetical protein HK096_005848, partial [Nowakowskiella sp. JEL0078]